jgi:peptidoglycan/xylan/chitin deacetylase (PgdA/CDA1 family)
MLNGGRAQYLDGFGKRLLRVVAPPRVARSLTWAEAVHWSKPPAHTQSFILSAMTPFLFTLMLAPVAGHPLSVPDSLRVPILVYHNIQSATEGRKVHRADLSMRSEVFAAQMQYLKEHDIHVVALSALVDALEGRSTLPAHAVVITFDDGHEDQYVNAVPVLKKLRFTAAFFPFTHAMDRNAHYFTWSQLRELQQAGMIIGSHTSLHIRMDKVHDPKVMREEVSGSRDLMRRKLGSDAEFFSYPFGALSANGEAAVRAAGYRAARAYVGGPWNSARDIMHLRSVPMTEDMARFRRIVDPVPPASHD